VVNRVPDDSVCSLYGRSSPGCSCPSGTAGRARREVAMAAAMALVLAPEQRHPSQPPPTTARHLWHGYILGQGCRREKGGVTVYGVRVFLFLMARRSGCLHHHLEHIQLFSRLSLGAVAVGGTQTHWGLWMTVNSPSFTCMEKFTDGR